MATTCVLPSDFGWHSLKWPQSMPIEYIEGYRIGCIGHWPHLWDSTLQPIHHSSKATACDTSSIPENTTELGHWFIVVVSLCSAGWNGCSGDFHRYGQYPMDLLWLPLLLTIISIVLYSIGESWKKLLANEALCVWWTCLLPKCLFINNENELLDSLLQRIIHIQQI